MVVVVVGEEVGLGWVELGSVRLSEVDWVGLVGAD